MSVSKESQVMRFTLLSKNILSGDEMELYELSQLAGVVLDPNIFKILLDLLKMNVAPQALLQMLKNLCGQRRKKVPSSENVAGTWEGDSGSKENKVRSTSRGRIQSGSRKSETRR